MTAFAVWALVQRERTLVAETRRETHAYATALGLALDAAFEDPDRSGVPEIVDRITRQPSVYAVLVYDERGQALFRPEEPDLGPTPAEVDSVLASGASMQVERRLGEEDVYSVVYPIRDEDDRVVGAFEVAQPLSFVREEMRRTRVRFFLNTAVLILAVTLLIQWLVHRFVAVPLRQLTEGVRAIGAGDLRQRIHIDRKSEELSGVAAEFNRMAESLQAAQDELVRGAEERLTLAQRVRHSEKMAAIGQLAAGLAHEIGAPLHVIRGRADLLARRTERPEKEGRDLQIIVQQIDRITGIVRSLLDFSRHREPHFAPLSLREVVDGVADLLAAEAHRTGVELRTSDTPSMTVNGDRDQLQQVVLNLLLNALQAVSAADGERVVQITGWPDPAAGQVVLRVTDSGPGVPPELAEQVFAPFFTTKAAGAGTGLGLAVARRIAEEHSGTLEAVPSETGGAFELRLPLPIHEQDHDPAPR